MMLGQFKVHPVLAAIDIERARRWYAEKLGLNPTREVQGELLYELGNGSSFLLYQTSYAGTAQNTVAEWDVDDIEAAVAELRQHGVVFEEYDFPGFETVDGIATLDYTRGAWFKDSEGNIIALNQWR